VPGTLSFDVARWNHPRWWIARMQHDWPRHWEQILEANNRPAPMTRCYQCRLPEVI
jgi:16S rRNA (cytosine967-C5)-methyltransferase